jgi:ankyrin repeat protein
MLFAGDVFQLAIDNDLSELRKEVESDRGLAIAKTEEGIPVINIAAFNGSLESVIYLNKMSAAINPENPGSSGGPIHAAVDQEKVEVLKWLLKNGADPNLKDSNGLTPLHLSAFGDSAEVTKLLLANGAKASASSQSGLTPLHRCKNVYSAIALVNAGADVNMLDKSGRNALHWMAAPREIVDEPTIDFLIKSGIDTKAKNSSEETPMGLAVKNDKEQLVKILKRWDKIASILD